MKKKLSIAFIWHMHQPVYRANPNEIYLMPWVRLHAVKDYLDMLLIVDKFPKLKLNFNLVPVLLDAIYDYGFNNAHDIYSKLTVTPVEELQAEEKHFILNHFFDANYQNMVLKYNGYKKLYEKRYSREDIGIDDFSDQEYSDIMAWFNICWFDPSWQTDSEVNVLTNQAGDFTLEDREAIIECQRNIIRRIVPTYKKYQEDGRIELSTSPYYHPILPLMIDMQDAEASNPNTIPPQMHAGMKEDAKQQIKNALDMFESVFGKRPRGVWPSEHCISEKTLGMFQELGIQWTISDEGVLEQSLKKEFARDFRGYLENPYDLCHTYEYKNANTKKGINIIFRDAVLPNLIGFEYPNYDPEKAANDLYERIKFIHKKLQNSPDKKHLLTIAMDGENCWENYSDDGSVFLETLYGLIEHDEDLETTLVSDYLDKIQRVVPLETIHPGSWINRDFTLWVGEPTKNLAWHYLDKTRFDLEEFEKETDNSEILKQAWQEIYICEGSDWFWWYGEPNDSGQDNIFDLLFRSHLMNVYKLFKKPIPDYLETPLIEHIHTESRYPKGEVKDFEITGKSSNNNHWTGAGCIDIPASPTMQENRFFNRICFEYDKKNLYLKFEVNKFLIDKELGLKDFHQIYLYFKNKSKGFLPAANVRTVNKTSKILPLLREKYTHEVKMTFYRKLHINAQLAEACNDNLWVLQLKHAITNIFDEFIEIKIPFEDLNIGPGETVEFVVIQSALGIVDDFIPRDSLLSLTRPGKKVALTV